MVSLLMPVLSLISVFIELNSVISQIVKRKFTASSTITMVSNVDIFKFEAKIKIPKANLCKFALG